MVSQESDRTWDDAPRPRSPFGHVLSCRGSEARIGLPIPVPDPEQRATVGKLVAIRSDVNIVIAMIAEVNVESRQAGESDRRAVARVDLMGEIVRQEDGSTHFRRGVRSYPAIGDAVEMIDSDHLRLVYSSAGSRSIVVGNLHQDQSIAARVDVDALLAKHFAVLGSTGVGKSSGVAVILGEILQARPDVRVLLLDVQNEYARCFGDAATVVGSHNLRLPSGSSTSRK
jgi:hypothetical protein